MKILVYTDAWGSQQVNGVVKSTREMIQEAESLGHQVKLITPDDFSGFNIPWYPEIKLACPSFILSKVDEILGDFVPDRIHISTEFTIGLLGRFWCSKKGYSFTSSFHTYFPEYFYEYVRLPKSITWAYLKWFHSAASRVFVTNIFIKQELESKKFKNIEIITPGVTDKFRHGDKLSSHYLPINLLYVGRIAREKNLEEFCQLSQYKEYSCTAVGDGPWKKALERKYPYCTFPGKLVDEELIKSYQDSDVFVFPSKMDTFGMVMLESLACGIPVVCRFGAGIIHPGINGYIYSDEDVLDINYYIHECLKFNKKEIAETVSKYSWKNVTGEWLRLMVDKSAAN
jgi:glycosyltransferase involved in cell wall biosynthesis